MSGFRGFLSKLAMYLRRFMEGRYGNDKLNNAILGAAMVMVILALFCTIGALFLLTYGIRALGASTASVLNMLEPVVSLIAGIIVYHEAVSFTSLLGCVFIVISGIVVVMDKKTDPASQA